MIYITNEEREKVIEAIGLIRKYINREVVPYLRNDVTITFGDGYMMFVKTTGDVRVGRAGAQMNELYPINAPYASIFAILVLNWHEVKAKLYNKVQDYAIMHTQIMNFEV